MISRQVVSSVGRTVPTFRMMLEHVISDWRTFRRALSMRDRTAFDTMMYRARLHAAAASNAARLNPTEALLMAILLEHENELEKVKESIESKSRESGESGAKETSKSKDDAGEG